MSGRQRGSGRKSELLDRLFGDKKRTLLSSVAVAVAGYVVFLIFGDIHATEDALYRPAVMGVLAFVALFLVLRLQLSNPRCSANAMDLAELFFALVSGIGLAIWMPVCGIRMLFGSEAYAAATMIAEGSGIWCALCLAHNLRKSDLSN